MAIHLRNKANRNRHLVIGVLCGSWKCPTCGPYLRKKWVEHLSQKLSVSEKVYVSSVDMRRWGTIGRRISRAGGQHITIKQVDGTTILFTDAPQGEIAARGTVLALLCRAMEQASMDARPVHTSHGWGLPKAVVRKHPDWERVGRLPATVEVVAKAVTSAGIVVHRFWGSDRTGFVAELPDNADIQVLKDGSIGVVIKIADARVLKDGSIGVIYSAA